MVARVYKSQILKFEKNSDPDLDSQILDLDLQILEQERNRSLKMWLQQPPGTWSLVDLCAAFLRV